MDVYWIDFFFDNQIRVMLDNVVVIWFQAGGSFRKGEWEYKPQQMIPGNVVDDSDDINNNDADDVTKRRGM